MRWHEPIAMSDLLIASASACSRSSEAFEKTVNNRCDLRGGLLQMQVMSAFKSMNLQILKLLKQC